MSLEIGRQGYLGVAIEAVAGTAESSVSRFIPFTENSLEGKHEPLMDISARASRVKDHNAVLGKKWSEGDVSLYADSLDSGYLWKLALGVETLAQVGSSNSYDHLFTPTVSGNSPKTATLWNYRGDDVAVKRHAYACVDQLELEVTVDEIATMKASVMAGFPSEVSAPALTTTSGTLLTWRNTQVRFGSTYAAALAATPTKLTSLKLNVTNNVEALYRTGNNEPDVFALGELEVTGEYSLYLEDNTEVNAYKNLDKRCMVIDLTGADVGGGNSERMRIIVRRMVIEDESQPADLGEFFAVEQSFRAIQGAPTDPGFFEVELRNQKSSVY